MRDKLNELLFETKFLQVNGENDKLYDTQSELALDIVENSTHYTDAGKLRPYLSQSLKKGDHKYSREMSKNLKKAIIASCLKKIDKTTPEYSEFKVRFEEAYKNLKSSKNFESDDNEYSFLLNWQTLCNSASIFNMEPLEVKWLNRIENKLEVDQDMVNAINLMFDRLLSNFRISPTDNLTLNSFAKLITENPDHSNNLISDRTKSDSFRCAYFVPSYKVGKRLWEAMQIYLYLKLKREGVYKPYDKTCQLLERINAFYNDQKDAFYRVFIVKGPINTIPVAYYESTSGIKDPRSGSLKHEVLFTLVFNDSLSVSTIENGDLEYWKEQILYPIYWDNKSIYDPRELKYLGVKNHIRKTNKIYRNEKT